MTARDGMKTALPVGIVGYGAYIPRFRVRASSIAAAWGRGGEGRLPVDWPASLLNATERPSTIAVAPAHGLSLLRIDYPADEDLAARSEITKNLRTASS